MQVVHHGMGILCPMRNCPQCLSLMILFLCVKNLKLFRCERLVGKHNIGYSEKMFYLKKYTSSEAPSSIEALFLWPDKSPFEVALKILEERFGNASLVATTLTKKSKK